MSWSCAASKGLLGASHRRQPSDSQPPYNSWKNLSQIVMLFDLDNDYHELHDLSTDPAHADTYARLMGLMSDFLASGTPLPLAFPYDWH